VQGTSTDKENIAYRKLNAVTLLEVAAAAEELNIV
jgi:hypothetical protein